MINDYDPCVANTMVNTSQMTMVWHVADLKVSHREGKEITKLLLYLGKIYGTNIIVICGKIHDYLGIDFNFSQEGVEAINDEQHCKDFWRLSRRK